MNDKTETTEMVPVDTRDDNLIIAEMQGQALKEYVYSFKQGGKQVTGLTIAGINEAANKRGGIKVVSIETDESEDTYRAIVHAEDTIDNASRYGAYEQPKKLNGKPDPFAFTKCIHKAQRNAIKQLLPVPVIKEVINYYLNNKTDTDAPPAQRKQTNKQSDKLTAHQQCTQTAKALYPLLEKNNITQSELWDYVKFNQNVQSSKNMTDEQWDVINNRFNRAIDDARTFKALVKDINAVKPVETDVETDEVVDVDADVTDEKGVETDNSDIEDPDFREFAKETE